MDANFTETLVTRRRENGGFERFVIDSRNAEDKVSVDETLVSITKADPTTGLKTTVRFPVAKLVGITVTDKQVVLEPAPISTES